MTAKLLMNEHILHDMLRSKGLFRAYPLSWGTCATSIASCDEFGRPICATVLLPTRTCDILVFKSKSFCLLSFLPKDIKRQAPLFLDRLKVSGNRCYGGFKFAQLVTYFPEKVCHITWSVELNTALTKAA